MLKSLKCNKKMAADFLNYFGDVHHFTCIHPTKKNDRGGKIVKAFSGTIDQRFAGLEQLNKQGYGIYFCVNDVGKSETRRINDLIDGCRCIYQEDDDGWLGSFPIEPTLLVQSSPGKYHRYWLPDDRSLSIDEFYACLRRMTASYGNDPNCADPVRVLRVPGFYHTKNIHKPTPVTFEVVSKKRLSADHIIKSFPDVEGGGIKARDDKSDWSYSTDRQWNDDEAALCDDIARTIALVFRIDPDCDYKDWIEVGMILKGRYGDRKFPFNVWDKWSAQSGKYVEAGERDGLLNKWQTFADRLTQGAVGVGTLSVRASAEHDDYESDEAMSMSEQIRGERMYKLNVLNDYCGYYTEGKDGYVLMRQFSYEKGGYEGRLLKTETMRNMLLASTVKVRNPTKDETKTYKTFDEWMAWHGRRRIDYTIPMQPGRPLRYKPRPTMKPLRKGRTSCVYEEYSGLTRKPIKGDWSLIHDHIKAVWCDNNEETFDYVLSWLATMCQKPWLPARTCLLLSGGEGDGKGVIIDRLLSYLGTGGITIAGADKLTAKFNWHLHHKVLVYGNEVSWGGNHKDVGFLKSLITDEHIALEDKGRPMRQVANVCHMIMSSNEDWPTHIDRDTRRYVMLRTNDVHCGDTDYFAHLVDFMDNHGGMDAFMHYLINDHNLKEYKVDIRPTGSKRSRQFMREVKLQSSSLFMQYLYEVFVEGRELPNEQPPDDNGKWRVSTDSLTYGYRQFKEEIGDHSRERITSVKVASTMRALFGVSSKQQRMKPDEGQKARDAQKVRGYELPDRDDARLLFIENFGRKS